MLSRSNRLSLENINHFGFAASIASAAVTRARWRLAFVPRTSEGRSNSTFLWTSTQLWSRLYLMNAQELRRLLASKGCTFETHKGGSGHLTVRRGDRKSQLPMHGSRKELGKGLVNKILKDLGLK
jgi:mRNA interferase HicA